MLRGAIAALVVRMCEYLVVEKKKDFWNLQLEVFPLWYSCNCFIVNYLSSQMFLAGYRKLSDFSAHRNPNPSVSCSFWRWLFFFPHRNAWFAIDLGVWFKPTCYTLRHARGYGRWVSWSSAVTCSLQLISTRMIFFNFKFIAVLSRTSQCFGNLI